MAGLLASVPTIQEEAEPPMSDDSYASSSTAGEARQSSIIILTGFTVQLSVFFALFLSVNQNVTTLPDLTKKSFTMPKKINA